MKQAGKNPENISIQITDDGSHTLYSERFNQRYHSKHGAVAESKHIFFDQNGLTEALQQREEINILEIGFGTGLNLAIMIDEYLRLESTAKINYHSIEAFPIKQEIAEKLSYGNYLNYSELNEILPDLFGRLTKGMNHFFPIPGVSAHIFSGFFDEFNPKQKEPQFDYIFHDAFSPSANPELWTETTFSHLLKWCNQGGLLTTYCAASNVRGAMASAGWKVARSVGAPGKREMTIASPSENPVEKFKRVNEERLARRFRENEF